MKIAKRILAGLLMAISIPFLGYFILSTKSYLDGQNLATSNNLPSLYVFEFSSSRKVVISDRNNKIIRSWGGSAKHIEIKNGARVVTFVEPAILKTDQDSIEPHEEHVKLKGYMGITTKDTEFTVNPEGVILSNEWHGG